MNNSSELEYFELGIAYYYGINDFFEDKEKALECFMNALDGGIILASFYIGKINEEDGNIRSAIDYYTQGGRDGYFLCYAELGRIYMSNDKYQNKNNADKAWLLFFKGYCEHDNTEESQLMNISDNEFGRYSFDYIFYSCLYKLELDTTFLYLMQPLKAIIQVQFDNLKPKMPNYRLIDDVQSYIDMI